MSADVAVKTFRARRRVKIAPDVWREPGELVPEAHSWFRLESWLHTGWLEDTEVSETEFIEAVEAFCPDRVDELSHQAGLGEVTLHGPQKSPHAPPAPRRKHRRTSPVPEVAATSEE